MTGHPSIPPSRFIRLLTIQDGNILATVRHFLLNWWQSYDLQAMLAPLETPDQSEISVQVITDPSEIARVNPFAPVMLNNTAAILTEFMDSYPDAQLAAILRPCELRTAIECQKRQNGATQSASRSISFGNLVTIGIDCLGTLSVNDYTKYVDILGVDAITQDTIVHAINGQTILDVRTACQICHDPTPYGADITIGLLGAHLDQYLLILTSDEDTYRRLKLAQVTDKQASEQHLLERDILIKAIMREYTMFHNQLITGNAHPIDELGGFLAGCACCTLCTDCLDVCPLYRGELAGVLGVGSVSERKRPILSELVGVARWLASCSGCGMCHEACEQGVPVTRLIASLSHHIQSELSYASGDPEQPLPWTRPDSRKK